MDDLTKKFMNGLTHVQDIVFLQETLYSLLSCPRSVSFPGAQPVSLERFVGLNRIAQEPFWACEKTDGTRYLLFIPGVDPSEQVVKVSGFVGEERYDAPAEKTQNDVASAAAAAGGNDGQSPSDAGASPAPPQQHDFLRHKAYFIDREFQIRECPILLNLQMVDEIMGVSQVAEPGAGRDKATAQQVLAARSRFAALFDGEVVTDTVPAAATPASPENPAGGPPKAGENRDSEGAVQKLAFYVFDCLYYGQHRLLREKFSTRMRFGNLLVRLAKFDGPDGSPSPGIHFHTKIFFPTGEIRRLFALIHERRLPHACDGVVFTSEDDPYTFGTTKSLQKWKPIEQNTIDCLLELKTEQVVLVTAEELETMLAVGSIQRYCDQAYIRRVQAAKAGHAGQAGQAGAQGTTQVSAPSLQIPPPPQTLLDAGKAAAALFRELSRRPATTLYVGYLYIASSGRIESAPIDKIYLDERKYKGLVERRDRRPPDARVAKGPRGPGPSRTPLIIEITWDKEKPRKAYDPVRAKLEEAQRLYYEYAAGGRAPPSEQALFNFRTCRYQFAIERSVDGGAWKSKGLRMDKRLPNDRTTYESVCRSYDEHVEWGDLCLMLEGKMPLPSGLPADFKSPFALYKRPDQDREDREEERRYERRQAELQGLAGEDGEYSDGEGYGPGAYQDYED